MKQLLVLLLVCMTLQAQSQKYSLKGKWIGIGISVLSGMAKAGKDANLHQRDLFPKNKYFDINGDNKYKDGKRENGEKFLGSTTIFVAATDFVHAADITSYALLGTGAALICSKTSNQSWSKYGVKPPKWHYMLDSLIIGSAFELGFNITYNAIRKRPLIFGIKMSF